MENNSLQICTRCILTENTPGIKFKDNGVCNFCLDYTMPVLRPESELIEFIKNNKSPESDYDCIVGLSGGRDSTFTLWKLVHDYKLKVLAVTYDNPFMSDQANKNIESALKISDTKGIRWSFPNNQHRKAAKKNLKIWAHHPSSVMVPIICGHCKTWWPGFFGIANKYKIKSFVIGSNPLETASFKKAGFGGARTYHKFSNVPKLFMRALKELIVNPRYLYTDWLMVAKMYLGASHSTPYMRLRYSGIKVVRLFDYIPWKEKDVEDCIRKNLAWEGAPEVESTWRFDCRLDFVRRKMYEHTIGITELRDLLSKLIRDNQISREIALQRIEKEEYIPEIVLDDVLSSVDMKYADLNLKKLILN